MQSINIHEYLSRLAYRQNPFGVISLDEKKVWLEKKGAQKIVKKRTTVNEYENLKLIAHWLKKGKHSDFYWEGDVYTIETPRVLNWNSQEGVLSMALCEGKNMEVLLREITDMQSEKRKRLVRFTVDFFYWMRKQGFLWKGACFRNMIVNTAQKKIYIFDFEKFDGILDAAMSIGEFKLFCTGRIGEEAAGFLFEDEQKEVFGNLWEYSQSKYLKTKSDLGTRQRTLMRRLFSSNSITAPIDQITAIEKIMTLTSTPLQYRGVAVFPILLLGEIQDTNEYADVLLNLYFSRYDREQFLKKLISYAKRNSH
jgi:hypothetical protein